jgi:hypothetical protein
MLNGKLGEFGSLGQASQNWGSGDVGLYLIYYLYYPSLFFQTVLRVKFEGS